MKTSKNIPATIVACGLLAGFGYHVYVTEARDYLAAEPRGYLYIALIALGGGVMAMIVRRAPTAARWRVTILARSLRALLLAGAVAWLIFRGASPTSLLVCLGIMAVTLFQIAKDWRRLD